MNVFISNGRFQALCKLVARILRIDAARAQQLIENSLAGEGQLTYEHLGRAQFAYVRDAARDLKVPMSPMIFEDLVATLKQLTPATPVCVNRACGEFTLQQQGAKYTPVMKGRCPWCTEIIEAKESAEVTHHLDWTNGAMILVTQTEHRHFGPRTIPLTEQGIRAAYPVNPGIEGLLQKRSITLVQFLNSLFCGSTAAQVSHPTDALAILGGTQKFSLNDLDVVAYEAKTGPYKRTVSGMVVQAGVTRSTGLTHEQRVELSEALMSAFYNHSQLKILVFVCGHNLETFAGSGPLMTLVPEVIQYAESNGWLDMLIKKAAERNPGNPKLRAFLAGYSA